MEKANRKIILKRSGKRKVNAVGDISQKETQLIPIAWTDHLH